MYWMVIRTVFNVKATTTTHKKHFVYFYSWRLNYWTTQSRDSVVQWFSLQRTGMTVARQINQINLGWVQSESERMIGLIRHIFLKLATEPLDYSVT